MGSGPSGTTTTTINEKSPQLIGEGKEGYTKAQDFYKDILANTPIYGGERVAPVAPARTSAQEQTRSYFGTRQPAWEAGVDEVEKTLAGDYGYGPAEEGVFGGYSTPTVSAPASTYNYKDYPNWEPATQEELDKWITSANKPILKNLENVVLPQIRDSSQLAGQGITSTRGDVARQKAMQDYAQDVSEDVYAPIFNSQQELEEDYDKKIQDLAAATLSGDADRVERASEAAAEAATAIEALKSSD